MGNNLIMKYIVYCTTCTENGKVYIGVHKTEDPDKFDGYIGNGIEVGWNIKNPHTAFQYALKKYGYSKFKRATLYVFDNAESAYSKEAEIVNKDFIKRHDNYNTCLGGIHAGVIYDTLYQYSYEGKLIKEWDSIGEAIRYYGCNSNRFNMAIKDKRSAFNSYWSKTKYDILDISLYRKSKHSEINCYESNGDLFKVYKNVQDIIQDLGFTKASIEDALSHKIPLKGFYFISDGSDINNIIKIRELVYSLTDKSVSKYKDGKLVKTYTNLTQAAKENDLSSTHIKKSIISRNGEWAYGYSELFENSSIEPTGLKIDQFDLEGNFIKTWNSYSECRKEHPNVKQVLTGGRNQTHGYTFKIHNIS